MSDAQEERLGRLEQRMDKYDEIIEELRDLVVALNARSDNNRMWINGLLACLTVGATFVGGIAGAVVTHLIH